MRRRGRGADVPKKRIVEIVSRTVAVKDEPSKYGDTLCQINKGVFCLVMSEQTIEGVVWLQIPPGWLCSMDSSGYQCYEESNEVAANKMWATEYNNRRRMAGAVTAMLTRTHSLPNGRRVSRAIQNYINSKTLPLVNLPDVSIEDLMVGLQAAQGLRQGEVLQFLKIAASQQCNPPKALKDMSQEISDMMAMRPSMWVKGEMNVIETMDLQTKNDCFIMAAAQGDIKTFDKFLAIGQELAALHSELKYTALHAAADFGHQTICKKLINTGMNLNVRDVKKGQTPLHYAGQSNRPLIAQLLLEAGADRNIASYKGTLPYQLADDQGNFEVREILKHPPPGIQYVTVLKFTQRSISIRWDPPVCDPSTHSEVIDFVVQWEPVGKADLVGHGDRFVTKDHTFKVNNLQPASGHGFTIYSRSAAGISEASSKLIQFTVAAPPEAPPPCEMLRISTNAIYLAWNPPDSDNGTKIDMYQVEIIDCEMGKELDREEKAEAEADRRKRDAKRRARKIRRQELRKRRGLPMGSEDDTLEDGDDDSGSDMDSDMDFENSLMEGSLEGSAEGLDEAKGEDEEEYDDLESEEEEDMFDEKGMPKSGVGVDLENSVETPSLTTAGETEMLSHNQSSVISSLDGQPTVEMPKRIVKGKANMLHRMFKTKQIIKRSKLCMGLEPYRPYQCRVRCRNALGYSKWSDWIGPITPQPGVYVLEFDREARSARIGWFRPILHKSKTLSAFEVQLALLDGPSTREIDVFAWDKRDVAGAMAWQTLADDLTTNEFLVPELRAGFKYRARVRYCVDGDWIPWQQAFVSDPIHAPACAPEGPFHVRPSKKPPIDLSQSIISLDKQDEEDEDEATLRMFGGMVVASDDADMGAVSVQDAEAALAELSAAPVPITTSTTAHTVDTINTANKSVNIDDKISADDKVIGDSLMSASVISDDEHDPTAEYDIKHNEIVIQWTNGNTNGSPSIEFLIEMAKIRDYTQADMDAAAAAAFDPDHSSFVSSTAELNIASVDNNKNQIEEEGLLVVERQISASADSMDSNQDAQDMTGIAQSINNVEEEVISGSNISIAKAQLVWRDITTTGEMLGPGAFRARDLVPGSSYVFRVRTRNEYGWSPWSASSRIITTYPCTPPSQPQFVQVSPQFLYVQWNESNGDSTGLTCLDFELQIGKVPLREVAMHHNINWEEPALRPKPELCIKPLHGVMVDKLLPGAVYVVRVRVRTIAGWSAWSDISKPQRTKTM